MDIPVSSTSLLAAPASQGLQLSQVVALLRRHLWLIVVLALAGAAAAYAYAATIPRSYTASSSIAVEGDRFAIPELQGALRNENAPDPTPWVLTEVQALSSRALVQGVVDKLHLDRDPEFNASLVPPTPVQRAVAWLKSFLPAAPPTPGAEGLAAGPDQGVLGAAMRKLVIFYDNRSLVIAVSFTARDPKLASDFVNTLVGDYITARASRRAGATQDASAVLAQRIDQARTDLDAVETRIRDLRSRNDVVGVRAGSVGQQQVEDLATAAARATLDRTQIEETLARATALSKQGASAELANVLQSPTISSLRSQESQASARVANLSSRYGSAYPGLRSAQADLASTRTQIAGETQRILASLDAQLRVARAHEADVKQQLDQARGGAIASQNQQAQLDQLKQDADTRRKLYETLLERAQQTVAQPTNTETPDVRVLSPAIPPAFPSGPNTKLASGLGGVAGGVLGCLLALTRVRSLDGFQRPADLTDATDLPVLATVPPAGRGGLAARVAASPSGPEAEAVRLLRARLRQAIRSGPARSIAFVSSTAASAVAADLAAAFARVAAFDGEDVLLVEANLRAPELGRLLGKAAGSPNGSLGTALETDADWRDLRVPDNGARLDLLLAGGASPADAHAVLSGDRFQNLLIEGREEYSLVVLAALPAADAGALTLAQRTDVTVLVVDGRRARRQATGEAASRLGSVSRNPVVAVLVAAP
jgi:uncharacterized protein involved in exopolysaccharide biosynthesis